MDQECAKEEPEMSVQRFGGRKESDGQKDRLGGNESGRQIELTRINILKMEERKKEKGKML